VVARPVDHVVDDGPALAGQVEERTAGRDGAALGDAPLQWMPPDPAALRAVTVVLRAGLLEEVTEVLERWDLTDEAVFTMVSGVGRGGGRTVSYRGQKHAEPLSRVCLTVPVEARDAEAVADALIGAARHGEKGDGKVWVI
jgi:nitrogen regulatory protein P-II 1